MSDAVGPASRRRASPPMASAAAPPTSNMPPVTGSVGNGWASVAKVGGVWVGVDVAVAGAVVGELLLPLAAPSTGEPVAEGDIAACSDVPALPLVMIGA